MEQFLLLFFWTIMAAGLVYIPIGVYKTLKVNKKLQDSFERAKRDQ